jgi:hypothetical protein
MADEYLRLGDMPKQFQEVLMREFVPYSELQRFVAKRMGATVREVESSHVPCSPSLTSCSM